MLKPPHVFTCARCAQPFHATSPAIPPLWEMHGSKLLCADCSGTASPAPAPPPCLPALMEGAVA